MNRVFLFAGQSDLRSNYDATKVRLNHSILFVYSIDVHKHDEYNHCNDWMPLQGQPSHKGHLTIAGFDLHEVSNGAIDDNLYIIEYAMGDSTLETEWIEYFDNFIKFVLSTLVKVPEPKQLCSLCWLGNGGDDPSSLVNFVRNVRLKLEHHDLLFMYAENKLQCENIDTTNGALYDAVNALSPSCFVTNEGLVHDSFDGGKRLSVESFVLIGRKLACKYVDIVSDRTKIKLRCKNCFDGESMHGPSLLTFNESGVLLSISPTISDYGFDYNLITPGFIDLQVNGYAQYDVDTSKEDLIKLSKDLHFKGTTSFLATLVTAPLSEILDKVMVLNNDIILGFHLEGPFIGKAPGAHNIEHIIPVDLEWLHKLPSSVKLMTLAPEQVNAIEGIKILREKQIKVSLGHSVPTKVEYELAVECGAAAVTHLYNAMSGIHHRDDGLALMSLTDQRVYCGIIADLIHVSPDAICLAFLAKSDHIFLVSDSIGWTSPKAIAKDLIFKDGAVRFQSGGLVGSACTMLDCVKNVVKYCNVKLDCALKSATSIPADFIGIGKGRLFIGNCNSINCFSVDLQLKQVLF